jgi:hypothetical protein
MPSIRNIWIGLVCIVIGIFLSALILPLVLIPVGIVLAVQGFKQKEKNDLSLQQRKVSLDATHSVLMSRVEYVGGHPLVPTAGVAVLGLSPWALTLYSTDTENAIAPIAEIPLESIVQAGMGRPKSAREVYDEDYGYTIDVYEHSPFLSVVFELDGKTYCASFEAFEPPQTPQEWCNQITALGYQSQITAPEYQSESPSYALPSVSYQQAAGQQTHMMAIVGLVFGIMGITICPGLGSIVAIVTSYMALKDIRAEPARYAGGGLAKVGLIIGLLELGIFVLVACCLAANILLGVISSILQSIDKTLGFLFMPVLCDVFA